MTLGAATLYYFPVEPYCYKASVRRVVDGDTLVVEFDLGFGVSSVQTVRVLGIDAPETRGESRERGLAAKAFVRDWLSKRGSAVVVRTVKDGRDKYGRYLADVRPIDAQTPEPEPSLSEAMLAAGHAVAYNP